MMKKVISALLIASSCMLAQGRDIRTLSDGWAVKPISANQQNQKYVPVTLPHTWNALYIDGSCDYNRETMVYRCSLAVDASKRNFLYFEGANTTCEVYVNYRHAGSHKGGYTAFCVEITDLVKDGPDNLVEVWVSNAWRSDVAPLIGDFNVCGGLHRPVHLLTTGKECIDPLFHASPGVFVVQKSVDAGCASIDVKTLVSGCEGSGLRLRTTVTSPSGSVAAQTEQEAADGENVASFEIGSPALWNGLGDAPLYKVTAELMRDSAMLDRVEVTTGFRSLAADPDRGIILNGAPYKVRGVCRHEDFSGRGSALLPEDYEQDFALIREIGATGIRLAHYPHAECVYDFADREGVLVWTEIPFCGPGGWQFTGYPDTPEFRASLRENLQELVWQKFNHPSICFWGIFNEINYTDGKRFVDYGDPEPFARELGQLYKTLDPSRLTCFATCEDATHYLGVADLVAWNKYFGWYERNMAAAADFFDGVKESSAPYPVGISEYGAGASIAHHAAGIDPMARIEPRFHPEEKQSQAHEDNWAIIKDRPWFWGTFVWNLADFRSSPRREGDTDGINDKGLVTYDRSVRKDAFYFYKAEWTSAPMIYITSRRWVERMEAVTSVKVYSNQPKVTLYVNGRKVGTAKNDGMSRFVWPEVELVKGENEIKAVAGGAEDSCKWILK